MFAPRPLSANLDLVAEVTFKDWTRRTWVFPRMEELGYGKRYRLERLRKWRERVRLDSYEIVWPDTARFVARLHDRPGNPVATVKLVRRWTPILPPTVEWLPSRRSAVAMASQHEFFYYQVQREDVR